MNNINVTPQQQKREWKIFLACFIIAFLLNVYAVIAYESPAWELITSIFYVLVFAIVLYGVFALLRILFYLIKTIFQKRKTQK